MSWAAYLAELHSPNPGITEAVLVRARDQAGADPYEWLADPVAGSDSVLDLACGSAPLRPARPAVRRRRPLPARSVRAR